MADNFTQLPFEASGQLRRVRPSIIITHPKRLKSQAITMASLFSEDHDSVGPSTLTLAMIRQFARIARAYSNLPDPLSNIVLN